MMYILLVVQGTAIKYVPKLSMDINSTEIPFKTTQDDLISKAQMKKITKV